MSEMPNTTQVTDDEKLWSLLGYIFTPIVPIIVLLMEDKKNLPFLRYHTINALLIAAVYLILSITSFLIIPLCAIPILWIYSIYLAIKAYQGEMNDIPMLTDLAKNQGWM